MEGVGIGTDGTIYTSGNANTLVNAVYLVGLGRGIDITGNDPATVLNSGFWINECPFTTTGIASIGNLSGSTAINFVDPFSPFNLSLSINNQNPVLKWQSITNLTYYMQRSTNLSKAFTSIQNNLVGQAVSTSFTDSTATNGGPYFYRAGVQLY